MCGAAAESILLAAAISKSDERTVLDMYNTSRGRSRVEKLLVGKAKGHIQREFPVFLSLLKYWRDEASHGGAAKISDNEAYTSLMLLLRFAIFVRDNWDELVTAV